MNPQFAQTIASNRYFTLICYYDPISPGDSTVALRMQTCPSCKEPCEHSEKQEVEFPAYMWEAIRQQPTLNLHVDQNDGDILKGAVDIYESDLSYFKDYKTTEYQIGAFGINLADDRDKNIHLIFNELKKRNDQTLEIIKKIEDFKKSSEKWGDKIENNPIHHICLSLQIFNSKERIFCMRRSSNCF